jgi:hypothetical protein
LNKEGGKAVKIPNENMNEYSCVKKRYRPDKVTIDDKHVPNVEMIDFIDFFTKEKERERERKKKTKSIVSTSIEILSLEGKRYM